MDTKYAIGAGLMAFVCIVFGLIFRMIGVFISVQGTNLNTKERLFCMMAYCPKATVQAAIGAIPLAMGLECGQIVLTVAVLAILFTAPFGAFCIDSTYKKFLSKS